MDPQPVNLHRQPWGTAVGLLVGCLAVLIGLARSVSPAEIVVRAAVAALITAIVIRMFIHILMISNTTTSEDN